MSAFTTPTTGRKSEAQTQADMQKLLFDHLEQESDEELVDRDLDKPKTPKSKKRAGKPYTPPSATTSNGGERDLAAFPPNTSPNGAEDDLQDSPSRRKSARIAAGVKRASPRGSYDAAVDSEQPPAKKAKLAEKPTEAKDQSTSPTTNLKRKSFEAGGENKQPPSKKKLKLGVSAKPTEANEQSTPPANSLKRKSFGDSGENKQPPSKKKLKLGGSAKPTSLAAATTIQKHTGRFTPMNSVLPRATKIEKQPVAADNDDAVADDETADADIEGDEEEATVPKGKGKVNKTVPTPFKGNPDMMGSSIEKPEDAPNTTHWKCANRNCTSGQTWHNRDGVDSYGRKVISNFFGRNKKETNLINAEVWHNYCRKDYQRGTYRVGIQNNKAKCNYYIDNIEMQLVRLKLWRPEAKFNVQLSKGAQARLGTYHKELNKNNGDQVKAKKAVTKTAGVNAKGKEKPLSLEDAFPIEQLRHFDETFCSENQGFDELDQILDWTKNLVENELVDSMPPMEFLITKQADEETVIDPNTNYERWAAYEDGRDFDAPDTAEGADDQSTEQVRDDDEETIPNSDSSVTGDETQVEQSGHEIQTEVVTDDDEETVVNSDASAAGDETQTQEYGRAAQAEQVNHDSEAKVESSIGDQVPNVDDLESLTDDETSDDDVSELDLPESVLPPKKKKYQLHLVDPANPPSGSSYGATPGNTPSKYPRLPPGPFA